MNTVYRPMDFLKTQIFNRSFAFAKVTTVLCALAVFSTGCAAPTGSNPATVSTVATNGQGTSTAAATSRPKTLLNEVELLTDEVRKLVDRIELFEYEIKRIQDRQVQLYEDLDLRLREIERKRSGSQPTAAVSVEQGEGSSSQSISQDTEVAAVEPAQSQAEQDAAAQPQVEYDPQEVRDAYDVAFRSLREGRYEDAIVEFQSLIDTYPGSELMDDALYWIGEANYVTQKFEDALPVFERVLREFPTAQRAAESMLKIGYIFYDLEDYVEAQDYLMEVINRYPASRSAFSARRRLDKMEREGLL